jgi:hypothetical protein
VKRRTEITIETERLVVMGARRQRAVRWCVPCDMHVEMLTTDEAALLAHVTSRIIFSWVEAGRVHYTETDEGLLLICPNSLS